MADADWLQASFTERMPWNKPEGYFVKSCRQQEEGSLILLLAEEAGNYLGHLKVVWAPDYPYFQENNIPEIQDLNVVPSHRRQGIATGLVDEAERLIAPRSPLAGIGFGLYADYGNAQRMYVLRGYVPDGRGIHYKNKVVQGGETICADDDLVLFLTKKLK